MCLFVTGEFYLSQYSNGYSKLQHVSEFCSLVKVNNIPLYNHILLIHSPVIGYLGSFYFLAIVKNAVNKTVEISLQDLAFKS